MKKAENKTLSECREVERYGSLMLLQRSARADNPLRLPPRVMKSRQSVHPKSDMDADFQNNTAPVSTGIWTDITLKRTGSRKGVLPAGLVLPVRECKAAARDWEKDTLPLNGQIKYH